MKNLLIIILGVFFTACGQKNNAKYSSFGRIDYALSEDDEAFLDSIQEKTFRFFLNEHHPQWGIVKDRALETAPSSIASTGFGLPCFAIGVERNWITRVLAAEITLNTLEFLINAVQNPDADASGFKGFYYHFLSMETGKRVWRSELSSIDSGLLAMGILFAKNYYSLNNNTEKKIRLLAKRLLDRMNWNFFDMPEDSRHPHTISMGWKPEDGLIDWGWYGYNEGLFLYILAAGMGMKNIGRSYDAWIDTYKWLTPYEGLAHLAFPPLFGHQFSHAFIDFRGLADSYMEEKGIDYFENSRRATLTQQKYAMENPHGWVGYDSLCWGVTASDGPGDTYNFDGRQFYGYAGRGTSGPDYNYFDDGTIAPYAILSSIPFAPEIVLPAARSIIEKNGTRIWGKYGFFDSFNLTADWVADDYIGVAQGPMLIMIENFRSGLVWDYIMKDPVIQKGLKRLGFEYLE